MEVYSAQYNSLLMPYPEAAKARPEADKGGLGNLVITLSHIFTLYIHIPYIYIYPIYIYIYLVECHGLIAQLVRAWC